MKFKEITLQIKEVSDAGTFTGYAAVFNNVDLGGDIIAPGAFTKTISEKKDHPVLWGHSPREVIGINKSYTEDSKGLYVEGQLIMDVQRARETHALMKAKAVKGMSIGYDTVIETYNKDTKTRTLNEVKLWEYSLTPFPMNPEAQVTGVKSVDEFKNLLKTLLEATAPDSQERAVLIAEFEKTLSSLRAAKAPGADTQDTIAPEFLHAGLDRIANLLRGEL